MSGTCLLRRQRSYLFILIANMYDIYHWSDRRLIDAETVETEAVALCVRFAPAIQPVPSVVSLVGTQIVNGQVCAGLIVASWRPLKLERFAIYPVEPGETPGDWFEVTSITSQLVNFSKTSMTGCFANNKPGGFMCAGFDREHRLRIVLLGPAA